MLASAAIALLLSGAAEAQTVNAKSIKPKTPVVSPVAKSTPRIVQNPRVVIPPPPQDVEAKAYSDLVDNVSESLDQFSDDNVTGNQGRDHLGSSDTEASGDDAESKTEKKPRR